MKDQNIIEAIASGKNKDALQQLYQVVLPKVVKYVLSKKGALEDAKDVFQDAVIVFIDYVKKERYDETRSIEAFVFTTAKYLWINKFKRDSRLVELSEINILETEKIVDRLQSSERNNAMEIVLNAVGEKCKQLLKMIWYDSLSLKEVAVRMELPNEVAAKSNAYRCKKKLKSYLEENPSYREALQSE